jgi:S23 ribosomal protein.
MRREEFKQELEVRTRRFAVQILNALASLPERRVLKVIVYQLAKSATSVGANYREANRAESKDDFVHKLGIVVKEASETVYWLELLMHLTKVLSNRPMIPGFCRRRFPEAFGKRPSASFCD